MNSRKQSYFIYLLLFIAIVAMVYFNVKQQPNSQGPLTISEIAQQINEIQEATRESVTSISAIGDADGREYAPREVDQHAKLLREQLLSIQERRVPDPYGWISEVKPVVRPA